MKPITALFASLVHSGPITNAEVFPYGVACVAAYAKEHFGDDLTCQVFHSASDLNDALLEFAPDFLCLSNYTWNSSLSLAFAKEYAERYPSMITVMGGPNISITQEGRREFLSQNRAIDFYVKWDGELAFTRIVELIQEFDFDSSTARASRRALGNCLYLDPAGGYVEGPDERVDDMSAMPSPYQMGLLDKFFLVPNLGPIVETTRGCPYGCTFCVDSHSSRNKIKRRSQETIEADFEYIASHARGTPPLTLADLNFGMFKEDLETARIIRDTISKHSWPRSIITALGKSHPDRIYEAVKIINSTGINALKFASSFQSTDPVVLKAVARRNLATEDILSTLNNAGSERENADYSNELILGLPEDNKLKHFQTLRDCVDGLETNFLNVHQLSLLQGSPLALPQNRKNYEFDVRHRIFPGRCATYLIGETRQGVIEIDEVVVGTRDMPFDDWIECRIVNLLIKIYLDHDCFIELFGLIRRLGLSPFDLLLELKNHHVASYPGFSALLDQFVSMITENLFTDRNDLITLSRGPEMMKKYESGELGGNEMVVCRSHAYLDHSDDIHAALMTATKSYLGQQGKTSDALVEYCRQAIDFSRHRKFHFPGFQDRREDRFEFDFDFIAASAKGFRVLPSEIKIPKTAHRFFYSDHRFKDIFGTLEAWLGPATSWEADVNEKSLGRLFQKVNLSTLARDVDAL